MTEAPTGELVWPEAIDCHGDVTDGGVFMYPAPTWREPRLDEEPCPRPFRTCSWCGSMHPQDLLEALAADARLQESDWKYGWPHKFYVAGIANPLAGKTVRLGERSCSDRTYQAMDDSERSRHSNWRRDERDFWVGDLLGPAPAHTHAKWYNEHLRDLQGDAFVQLVLAIKRRTGILFARSTDGRLVYSAPSRSVNGFG